ncbi:MAG TPA: transposase [Alphaproteobacteria bacterium]|nr:transposase [Alphaproteobacteria bacterium]
MNTLPRDRQIQAIASLCEGVSIRATERLTGIHRDTIMRLGVQVGQGCATLHDRLMRQLHVNRIEIDEIWSYVGKKRQHVKPGDSWELGDQYVFIALADSAKAIVGYRIGKRDGVTTHGFISDLRQRVVNEPEFSSDAFTQYPSAVEAYFGDRIAYGTIEKHYSVTHAKEASRRYSPGHVVDVTKSRISGRPTHISTSYVERQNLTIRMQQRRFTRLTNAFSKKLGNHAAAVALYAAHYNFCRVHETLRLTPAMQLGVTDHVWTIAELIEAALKGEPSAPPSSIPPAPLSPSPLQRRLSFKVIKGGVS